MANDLASPEQLASFAGAPFTAAEVDAAVAQLRAVLGWHVAPVRATEHVLGYEGTAWRLLPTMRLGSVDEVTDAETGDPLQHRATRTTPHELHVLQTVRPPHEVSVTMTHGHDECPADLLQVLAGIVRGRRGGLNAPVASVGNNGYQVSFVAAGEGEPAAFSAQATVDRYTLFDVGFA